MDLTLDPEKFENHQHALIEEITKTIVVKLVEGGLEGRQMRDLTASIAFSIASIIDDNAHIQSDGEAVKPYLAFRSGENELIHSGENSYMHESVYDILKQMFDSKAD